MDAFTSLRIRLLVSLARRQSQYSLLPSLNLHVDGGRLVGPITITDCP